MKRILLLNWRCFGCVGCICVLATPPPSITEAGVKEGWGTWAWPAAVIDVRSLAKCERGAAPWLVAVIDDVVTVVGIRSSFMAKWLDWHYIAQPTQQPDLPLPVRQKAFLIKTLNYTRRTHGLFGPWTRFVVSGLLSSTRGAFLLHHPKGPPLSSNQAIYFFGAALNERSAYDDASSVQYGRPCRLPARLRTGPAVSCGQPGVRDSGPGPPEARYLRNPTTDHEHYGPEFGRGSSEVNGPIS